MSSPTHLVCTNARCLHSIGYDPQDKFCPRCGSTLRTAVFYNEFPLSGSTEAYSYGKGKNMISFSHSSGPVSGKAWRLFNGVG